MRQKKSTLETEQQPQPALALRPSARSADEGPYGSFDMDVPKEERVMPQSSPRRLTWIVGLFLLIASAAGAAWALNNGATDHSAAPDAGAPAPESIVALGLVDNDPRTRNLFPLVPGQIIEVIAEGKRVKKGDLLLRLDPQFARAQVKEAEAALDNAKDLLELAKLAPQKHEVEIKTQESAVAAAENKQKALLQELEATRDSHKEKLVSKRVLDTAEYGFKAMENIVAIKKYELALLKLKRPQIEIARAESDVRAKEAQLERAKIALEKCDLPAPDAGIVLRVFASPGESVGGEAKVPAIQFCPIGKRIVRAEVLQEWAGLVAPGQKVMIEDDTRAGPKWSGTVTRVSDWITQKRNVMLEPFMVNDVRTLECLIDVHPGGGPLRIGQRVRVTIEQGR